MPAKALHKSPSPQSTVFSFPQFTALPLEIRLKILSYLLPPSRIVDVHTYALPPVSRPSIWASSHAFPTLFHVCHDARRIGFKLYDNSLIASMGNPKLSLEYGRPGPLYDIQRQKRALLDPKRDILLIQEKFEERRCRELVSSLSVLCICLSPNIMDHLRQLAIPYCEWREARQEASLKCLMEFKGLEELYVLFMAGRVAATDWSGAVGFEIQGHMKEVEDEVCSDLEMLGNANPGWRKPELRVVSNRKSIAEVLDLQEEEWQVWLENG